LSPEDVDAAAQEVELCVGLSERGVIGDGDAGMQGHVEAVEQREEPVVGALAVLELRLA
jgi:hypothetical protein